MYGFLSHIIPFDSIELEKLYAYLRFLFKKLPKTGDYRMPELEDEIALEFYRLEKTFEGSIDLEKDSIIEQKPIVSASTKRSFEEKLVQLSTLIEKINKIFGTEFSASDGLFLKQLEEDMLTDESIIEQVIVNSLENFKLGLNKKFDETLIARRKQNAKLVNTIISDADLKSYLIDYFAQIIHSKSKEAAT